MFPKNERPPLSTPTAQTVQASKPTLSLSDCTDPNDDIIQQNQTSASKKQTDIVTS